MLWLCCYFPQLQLDAVIQQPAYANSLLPVVIYDDASNQITQLNQEAYAQGLREKMGMAQACALCPNVEFIAAAPCDNQLTEVADTLYQVVSDILVQPPNALFIRVDPMLRYYGGFNALLAILHHQLDRFSYQVFIATGQSPAAAAVIAKSKQHLLTDDRKVITTTLHNISLLYTDISARDQTKLERVGITTVGQLLSKPLGEIGKRFNNELIMTVRQLQGEQAKGYCFYHPVLSFEKRIEFSYEITHTDRLQPYLDSLLNDLAHFLQLRNKVTPALNFELIHADGSTTPLQVSAGSPQAATAFWRPLLLTHVEKLVLRSPAREARLVCKDIIDFQPDTRDYFSARADRFALAQLTGHLIARLGKENIIEPTLCHDHRLNQLSSQHFLASSKPTALSDSAAPALLITPSPLTEKAHIVYGPERIETGWWDKRPYKRDYFLAQTHSGQYIWIFKNASRQWCLAGWFS